MTREREYPQDSRGSTEKVVVTSTVHITENEHLSCISARFVTLGLTAYGHSEEEALNLLKRLFNKEINSYRNRGILEERLNKLEVEWDWVRNYPSSADPYEDTDEALPALSAPTHTPAAKKQRFLGGINPSRLLLAA